MRQLKRVILHCAATPDYSKGHDRFDLLGASDIDRWHRDRGFKMIGYHYVIRRTGVLEKGRPIAKIGAHTQGHNVDSIGICYIGTKRPTQEQVDTLLKLAKSIHEKYGLKAKDWFGHYEFNAHKECPGLSMVVFRNLLSILLG